ncbi:Protein fluG [Talaromyces atroroseus]|uniref:Protein fluG n=1 Tax=Talaromyces atroroseus TaxID=1441469 RepID=A0A225ARB1_TALAT|nr:Protein fluG [Talaromyces atroroseus]OKL60904.1 Protein fluG [Talaromyces atroroseus]
MDLSLNDLRHLVQTHPTIDNHAHNILSRAEVTNYAVYPLEHTTSECVGASLSSVRKTLPHHRAVSQLSRLLECDPTWDAVTAARGKRVQEDYESYVKLCLQGTEILLLDDLLLDDGIEPYTWHDQFIPAKTKRIVRIETIAARLLQNYFTQQPEQRAKLVDNSQGSAACLLQQELSGFKKDFLEEIRKCVHDPDVVGFKSVICYRTGLNVDPDILGKIDAVASSFLRIITKGGSFRIEDKNFNDWLLLTTLGLLTETNRETGISLPVQFHTGYGDSDISLIHSNPAYLQPTIEAYPDVDFVLLHSSYPYTREAGYLATVYHNVWLDLGVVFPMVSRNAQESILRDAFDITPTSKLLWSTDGHSHPESFLLANTQFRAMLEKILVDYVENDDLTLPLAIEAAADILYNNSNKLYSLNLPPISIAKNSEKTSELSPSMTKYELNRPFHHPVLDQLLQNNSDSFVWIQVIDYTATLRLRMMHMSNFLELVKKERRLGLSMGTITMLQNDTLTDAGTATGQYYLVPDIASLRPNIGIESSNSLSVMTFWQDNAGNEIEGCPRSTLRRIVNKCETELGLNLKFGFEIEIVFVKAVVNPANNETEEVPVTTNHAWSSMTTDTIQVVPVLEEIVLKLKQVGIHIEQFHAESCPGQFEFVLPPERPLVAVDTLIQARQIITNIARQHGIRATLYPRPWPNAAGTASHAHFSITPTNREDAFLAGIMRHLVSVLAFSLPQEVSYARVAQGVWAGGEWVTWGTENREAPIRKVSSGHWELKSLDGLANPYLAMSALVAAGYLGVAENLELTHKDCHDDAALMTPAQRKELGITTPLAKTLDQSLQALQADMPLQRILGTRFVKNYCCLKEAESKFLASMPERVRRQWLIERY